MNADTHWRGLTAEAEPRYAAIASIVGDRVCVDIGCGSGALGTLIPDWIGVEPDPDAACIAGRTTGKRVIWATADGWMPGRSIEAVVFNESLYYMADPVGVLLRYSSFLAPGGIIIASIFLCPRRPSLRRILRHLGDHRTPVSNCHCLKMILRAAKRWGWAISQRQCGESVVVTFTP